MTALIPFCNLGMCIHSCPFITPGLRRTPEAKQCRRSRTTSYREKVGEQNVDVPEEKGTEATGIAIGNVEQKAEQPKEKDEPVAFLERDAE